VPLKEANFLLSLPLFHYLKHKLTKLGDITTLKALFIIKNINIQQIILQNSYFPQKIIIPPNQVKALVIRLLVFFMLKAGNNAALGHIIAFIGKLRRRLRRPRRKNCDKRLQVLAVLAKHAACLHSG
jgi:hypothetical protein